MREIEDERILLHVNPLELMLRLASLEICFCKLVISVVTDLGHPTYPYAQELSSMDTYI